jgi:hypothetical protein
LRAVGFRRPMSESGSSPIRCAETRPADPARGKAQGRIDSSARKAGECGSQMGVKPRSRTPSLSRTHRFSDRVTPTKINRGGCAACETTRGPGLPEMECSPIRGNKPAKGGREKPRSAAGRALKEGGTFSPHGSSGKATGKSASRSGTPRRKETATVHDAGMDGTRKVK